MSEKTREIHHRNITRKPAKAIASQADYPPAKPKQTRRKKADGDKKAHLNLYHKRSEVNLLGGIEIVQDKCHAYIRFLVRKEQRKKK
jgi:hypothetical protein